MLHVRVALLIISVTLVIVYSWFNTGQIISNNSEENLNILNAQKSAQYYSTPWYPVGTGLMTPLLVARFPIFLLLSYLQDLEPLPFLIQALFLGTIMVVGTSAMYFLIIKGFEMKWQVAILGSIFYLLNLYSMTQIWKRFLYNGMISWAYLPLFLFLWIKSFTSNSLKWPIFFLLSSPFFTYTFSHPAYLFTFWVPAGIFLIFQMYNLKDDKQAAFRLIFKSFLIFLLWIFINIWWIYPIFKVGESFVAGNIPQWQANFDSLLGVSKYFGISDVLLLRQKAYFSKDSLLSTEWFGFYNNPLILTLSIIILFYMLFGLIKSKNQKYWGYLVSILAIGWFISKGSNFPFGHTFFYFLFSIFPITGALRNPYEKFGLVWLLPYSIFFALGIYWVTSKLKPKWRYIFVGSLLILFCGILVYPMWNGDIFPLRHRLTVPSYYFEANDYLRSRSNGRIFHIPFTTEIEKINYSWGYVGEDPSENLFDLETLTEAGVPIFDNFYRLIPKFLGEQEMPKILGLLGAEYVILHTDMTYPKIDVDKIIKQINNWEGIAKEKEFGELIVYIINKELVKSKIYSANSWVMVQNIEDGLKRVIDGELDVKSTIFTFEDLNINQKFSSNNPIITFEKKSNVRYLIEVKEAQGPYILVLNNTFDNLWQARVDNRIIEPHFTVNGFANGWVVKKIGDYTIELVLKVWPWD